MFSEVAKQASSPQFQWHDLASYTVERLCYDYATML